MCFTLLSRNLFKRVHNEIHNVPKPREALASQVFQVVYKSKQSQGKGWQRAHFASRPNHKGHISHHTHNKKIHICTEWWVIWLDLDYTWIVCSTNFSLAIGNWCLWNAHLTSTVTTYVLTSTLTSTSRGYYSNCEDNPWFRCILESLQAIYLRPICAWQSVVVSSLLYISHGQRVSGSRLTEDTHIPSWVKHSSLEDSQLYGSLQCHLANILSINIRSDLVLTLDIGHSKCSATTTYMGICHTFCGM